MGKSNFAVFVDLENVGAKEPMLRYIIEKVKIRGDILLGKVYGYTDRYSDLKQCLLSNTFSVVPSLRYGKCQKNNLDIQLVIDAMHSVDMSEALRSKLTLVVAIADHIHGAVSRGKPVAYPLEAEVRHLYADDFALAQKLLTAINSGLHKPLAPDEAVALTLHLVNAGFAVGDLSGTYRMTGLIQQILAVIGSHNDT